MSDDALSQAISSRGVRVGAIVPASRLPVYQFGAKVPLAPMEDDMAERRDLQHKAVERIRAAYARVERDGEVARRVGRTVNPYHPVRAAQWHNAWRRGWNRG